MTSTEFDHIFQTWGERESITIPLPTGMERKKAHRYLRRAALRNEMAVYFLRDPDRTKIGFTIERFENMDAEVVEQYRATVLRDYKKPPRTAWRDQQPALRRRALVWASNVLATSLVEADPPDGIPLEQWLEVCTPIVETVIRQIERRIQGYDAVKDTSDANRKQRRPRKKNVSPARQSARRDAKQGR